MLFYRFVDILFQVYFVMLFSRIILSWIPEFQGYKVVQFIAYYTDPYLNFFRRFIPPLGMIDISPIFAFFGLSALEYVVKTLILNLIK